MEKKPAAPVDMEDIQIFTGLEMATLTQAERLA